MNGGTTTAGASNAAIIGAGVLGHLREVICWTDMRAPGADLVTGLRNFRDRGCRLLAGPLLALGLEHPATVFATGSTELTAGFPQAMAVRCEFPVRGERAGVVLTWYDGEWAPPYETVDNVELSACGALYLGHDGQLLEDGVTGRRVLLRDGEPLRELAPSDRQTMRTVWQSREHRERVDAVVSAGIASWRVRKRLDWDGPARCARNSREANALLQQSGGVCG